jgi:hypothetical protein
MTETTRAVRATDSVAAGSEEPVAPEQELTEEGRYIPYSGGSMGWFENSGVLKCELGNNYLYYTAMASDRVRSKQFERWGERFNRRGERRRFKRMTGVTLATGTGKRGVRGTTRDISRHGVRIQFLEEVVLSKGDDVQIKIHQDEQSDAVVFDGPAHVVWSERIGKIRPVWNIGLTFENLSPEHEAQLKPLLQD